MPAEPQGSEEPRLRNTVIIHTKIFMKKSSGLKIFLRCAKFENKHLTLIDLLKFVPECISHIFCPKKTFGVCSIDWQKHLLTMVNNCPPKLIFSKSTWYTLSLTNICRERRLKNKKDTSGNICTIHESRCKNSLMFL